MGARTVLGEGRSRIEDIPGKRLLLLLVCAGGILLGLLRLGKDLRRSNVEKLSVFLLKRLEKQGYRKRPSEGLEEFAGNIDDEKLRREALQVIRAFEDTYYRDGDFSRDQIKALRRRIRGLQRSRNDS